MLIPQVALKPAGPSLRHRHRLLLLPLRPLAALQTMQRSSLTRGRGVWRKGTPAASRFDNAVLRELPIDPETENFVRSAVSGACYSRVKPTPIANPQLVIASKDALKLAGIDVWRRESDVDESDAVAKDELVSVDELVPFLAGNELFPGSETAAQCYCGHQFGYFSGQLGDGAAIYLGETVNDAKERWEVQLKGAGLTPYSRTADGRKVLRSTLREFLASEHMHALGVPTTRAASVVVSHDTTVVRDMFYDGNPKREPTAVVMRIAQSFLRFGSFEIFKQTDPKSGRRGPSAGLTNKAELMRQMLAFTIKQYFPAIHTKSEVASVEEKYKLLFEEVVQRTARLVAKWQSIGFCHGVLNTDNLSIVGDTLDYGPFGFMEHFNPEHVCNTSDDGGRYRYEAQPDICKWNLTVLADQLALVVDREELEPALDAYTDAFNQELSRLMRAKLGLLHRFFPSEDRALVDSLFDVLTETGADFTCTFRALADVKPFDERSNMFVVDELASVSENLDQMKQSWEKLVAHHSGVAKSRLNGRSENAEVSKTDEDRLVSRMNQLLFETNSAVTEAEHHRRVRESWEKWMRAYSSRLQKESDGVPDVANELHRFDQMRRTNPKFVLRGHVIQKAVEFALEGECRHLEHVFDLLTHPFGEGAVSDRVFAYPAAAS